MTFAELRVLYESHAKVPFPPNLRGEALDGIDLVLLDADTGGYLQSYFGSRGKLERDQRNALRLPAESLAKVVKRLSGPEKAYLETLRKLAESATK